MLIRSTLKEMLIRSTSKETLIKSTLKAIQIRSTLKRGGRGTVNHTNTGAVVVVLRQNKAKLLRKVWSTYGLS